MRRVRPRKPVEAAGRPCLFFRPGSPLPGLPGTARVAVFQEHDSPYWRGELRDVAGADLGIRTKGYADRATAARRAVATLGRLGYRFASASPEGGD